MNKETRHPEDLIYEVKFFVKELSAVQEMYFTALVERLNLDMAGEDFLFDFIHNHDVEESFDEYLARFGKNYEGVLKK